MSTTDSSGAQQWNTSALIAALNAMQNPSADDWIMDSGASSSVVRRKQHVTDAPYEISLDLVVHSSKS
jgi:hypothetical protein